MHDVVLCDLGEAQVSGPRQFRLNRAERRFPKTSLLHLLFLFPGLAIRASYIRDLTLQREVLAVKVVGKHHRFFWLLGGHGVRKQEPQVLVVVFLSLLIF